MMILENLVDPKDCQSLCQSIAEHYRIQRVRFPNRSLGDSLVERSFSAYALPETEKLLLNLTEKISSVVSKKLYPTYSYCRIYKNGAVMKPHTDRAACEYSLSIKLGGDDWPLWFALESPTPVTMSVGSGVLYNGIETTHWRDYFKGQECTQVFLHWVDANGPNSLWKYDRRPSLGAKETEKTYWGKS